MFPLHNISNNSKAKSAEKPIVTSKEKIAETILRQGQLWADFTMKYPTEYDCIRELASRVRGGIIFCEYCKSENYTELKGGRLHKCNSCFKRTRVFSGTPLEGIRRPDAWLARIYFMEHGVEISSHAFSILASTASSTAQDIFKKLCKLITELMLDSHEVPSNEFVEVICKRSSDTPANQHPSAEIEAVEKIQLANAEEDRVRIEMNAELIATLDKTERCVFEEIRNHSVLDFDRIESLTKLEAGEIMISLTGLRHKNLIKEKKWGVFELVQPNSFMNSANITENTREILTEFFSYIRETFHGVSRKWLQIYLAAYWIQKDRKTWGLGKILDALASSGPSRLQFTSPFLLKVAV